MIIKIKNFMIKYFKELRNSFNVYFKFIKMHKGAIILIFIILWVVNFMTYNIFVYDPINIHFLSNTINMAINTTILTIIFSFFIVFPYFINKWFGIYTNVLFGILFVGKLTTFLSMIVDIAKIYIDNYIVDTGVTVDFIDVWKSIITLFGVMVSIIVPLTIIFLNNKNNEKVRREENELKYRPIFYSPRYIENKKLINMNLNSVQLSKIENKIFYNNEKNRSGDKYNAKTRTIYLINMSDYAIFSAGNSVEITIDNILFSKDDVSVLYMKSIPYLKDSGYKIKISGYYSPDEYYRLPNIRLEVKLIVKNLIGTKFEIVMLSTMKEMDEVTINVNKI